MYKEKIENVEVYFICYKKEEMELVETYYDEILDTHCWYFNAYLAYQYWKKGFKNLEAGKLAKSLLTVASSRYILYKLEEETISTKERKRLTKDLIKIEPMLKKIIEENEFLMNL